MHMKHHRATGGPVEPHMKAGTGMGPTGRGSGRGPDIVKKSLGGNKMYSENGPMAPQHDSGMGGGVSRLEMSHRAAKHYRKSPPARHTP